MALDCHMPVGLFSFSYERAKAKYVAFSEQCVVICPLCILRERQYWVISAFTYIGGPHNRLWVPPCSGQYCAIGGSYSDRRRNNARAMCSLMKRARHCRTGGIGISRTIHLAVSVAEERRCCATGGIAISGPARPDCTCTNVDRT
jgi:hypothetical protein